VPERGRSVPERGRSVPERARSVPERGRYGQSNRRTLRQVQCPVARYAPL
jgi:hypothetical protein